MDPNVLWKEIKELEYQVRIGHHVNYNRRKCVEKLGELIQWINKGGYWPDN